MVKYSAEVLSDEIGLCKCGYVTRLLRVCLCNQVTASVTMLLGYSEYGYVTRIM